MDLDEGKAKALELRESGAGDGDILMALNRAGLTSSDAEEIVKSLPGQNRASVEQVGAFEFGASTFGVLLMLALVPLVTLYFGGGLMFVASLFGVVAVVCIGSGIIGVVQYLNGEASGSVPVRLTVAGIPLPVNVKMHTVSVAFSRLGIGAVLAFLAFQIALLRHH